MPVEGWVLLGVIVYAVVVGVFCDRREKRRLARQFDPQNREQVGL